jgi:hypothetical protein
MIGDWRDYRPAIWLTMLGVAVALVVNPPYIGAFFIGGAIGAAIRIRRRRLRVAAAAAAAERGSGKRRRVRRGSKSGRR